MTLPGVPSEVEATLRQIETGARAADLESVSLDFKRAQQSFEGTAKDLAEAAACFTDTPGGGTLVVGVDDELSGHTAFLGCRHDGEALRRRICELTNPSLDGLRRVPRRGRALRPRDRGSEGLGMHTVGGRAITEPTGHTRVAGDRRFGPKQSGS